MNRRWCTYIIIALTIVHSSCNTYTTFYSNTFTAIPEVETSKVYRLDLSLQQLDSVPESISALKDLKALNLSNNEGIDLDKVFQKLKNANTLEVLSLDSLGIIQLPESILQFSNLKQLSLAYNPNLDLEHTFGLLAKLPIEFLSLKGNNIKELPDAIVEVASIKDLNLSYNALHDENSYKLLGKLPNLYSLWLDHNDLEALPKTIENLNQVHYFYLEYNRLKTLPYEMAGMRKTWVIHAGHNQFQELPEVFTTMRSLFMVHINNNNIQTIPEVYETERYPLAGLILDHNPISEAERKKAEKLFKGFFLLSFEQE